MKEETQQFLTLPYSFHLPDYIDALMATHSGFFFALLAKEKCHLGHARCLTVIFPSRDEPL
jgi:hypothetical protein